MRILQEIDSGTGFHKQKNLSGLFDRGKFGDRLLHAVVKGVKVFALQALDKIPLSVRDDYADIHPLHIHLNRLALGAGNFLCAAEGCGKNECKASTQREFAGPQEFHGGGVSPPTRRSERPSHLSTKRRSWCASAAGRPADSLCPRHRKVSFAMPQHPRSWRWQRLSSPQPASALSCRANPPFEHRSRKSHSPFGETGFWQQESFVAVGDPRSQPTVPAKRGEARSAMSQAASLASWRDGRSSTGRRRPSFARHAAKF